MFAVSLPQSCFVALTRGAHARQAGDELQRQLSAPRPAPSDSSCRQPASCGLGRAIMIVIILLLYFVRGLLAETHLAEGTSERVQTQTTNSPSVGHHASCGPARARPASSLIHLRGPTPNRLDSRAPESRRPPVAADHDRHLR